MILENGYKYAMNGMTFMRQCQLKDTMGTLRNVCVQNNNANVAVGNSNFSLCKVDYTESVLTGIKSNSKWDITDRANTHGDISNSNNSSIMNALGLWIGRGTTAPTFTDYQMEDAILFAEMPIINKTRYFNTNKYIELAYTFKNNTGNDITVTELGMYTACGYSNTAHQGSNTELTFALIARKIIDPVTVGSGYYATFNYRLNIGTPEV